MTGKSFNISLDFYRDTINATPAFNNSDYNSIQFGLFDSGVPYELKEGEIATVKIQDHTFILEDLTWYLGEIALGTIGLNQAELQVTSADTRITTFRFNYSVYASLDESEVGEDDKQGLNLAQFTVIADDYISDMQVIKAEVTQAFNDINTIKSDTQIIKDSAQTIKDETETLKNDVTILKSDTQSIKTATEIIKSDTLTIKNDAVAARDIAEVARDAAEVARDEAVPASVTASIAKK